MIRTEKQLHRTPLMGPDRAQLYLDLDPAPSLQPL